ncbi:MAG: Gfo/Idh/MocA family oxidoreductase [Firmicutes bacterium]|nr:Gfo/Idh/MocA family oxidoreductase [Bacillota bacterium]
MKKVTLALLGAGDRGMNAYGSYALTNPDEAEFVAVATRNKDRRKKFQQLHGLKDEMCFASWEELLDRPKLADAILICTPDRMHFHPAVKAIEKGYHILLEKPISTDPGECLKIGEYAQEYDRVFMLCYVLRYTPFFQALKKILDNGKIGRLISIHYSENVGIMHYAHSFVRGNWRNSEESCPMILSKSCHDMDIFIWLVGAKCVKVSSFGKLSYFVEANAPKGALSRCLDGCPAKYDCIFYAPDVYLRENSGFSSTVISVDTSEQGRINALKDGPYGRCVYKCDNDVVDHQLVNLEFENDVTISFSMCAFTNECTRTMKLMGTKGEIRAALDKNELEITDFMSGTREVIHLNPYQDRHSGGDYGIMQDFIRSINGVGKELTRVTSAVESHIIAFAAEKSRRENRVIMIEEYIEELKKQMK